jgi:sugar/nucleoside kinase (ribokinase family)
MSHTFDCLIAGDANIDLLVEGAIDLEIGKEKLASNLSLVLGGSSGITAFNLSRLGAQVRFVGVIGEDEFGRFVEEKLASGGVDVSHLIRISTQKTGVTIWHTRAGKRAGVTYAGTVAMLKPEQVTDALLKSVRHLHVGAYFLQTDLHAEAPDLFARAKRLGLTTSIDCNYDPDERWDANLMAVLKHSDLFFPNEDEALRISGEPTALAAARALASLARIVIVKCGADGAVVVTKEREFKVPPVPATIVDTTGAGDSFNAGFLAEFFKGSSLETCAHAAAVAGARSVQAVGGTAAFEN